MILHHDKKAFKDAIIYTADKLQILPIYIEKDYWVSYALKILFTHPKIKEDIIFKGGTSLAKCYNLISRFSEDIDLVILRANDESDNQSKRKLKNVGNILATILPEINIEGITHKVGNIRKTAHSYSPTFEGDFGQIRDFIVLEATWLGYHEPFAISQINSLIGNILFKNNQIDLAYQYELTPYTIKALKPTRTLCEKIMSLVRFSHSPNPLDALRNKIRHLYDIHQILKSAEVKHFFHSVNFEIMLNKVAADDVNSFKNNNKWLQYHPKEALIFNDYRIWENLEQTYLFDFSKLIYGHFPSSLDIQQTLTVLRNRIQSLNWNTHL